MQSFAYLIPVSLILGVIGLFVFFWTYHDGQYDDLDGASERILTDDDKPVGTKNRVLAQNELIASKAKSGN